MTTIRATESMKDSLAKEVIQELTHLNEIGRVKHEANEDFKIFIDRFKKLIGDVHSVDPN